jgi:large subunit ribosomal protein L54
MLIFQIYIVQGPLELYYLLPFTNFIFIAKSKTKRLKAKKARKQALLNPESMVPKVPLHEQSIDLPAGDGTVEGALDAAKARHELTKAMRGKRRASIKEANFLKAMS